MPEVQVVAAGRRWALEVGGRDVRSTTTARTTRSARDASSLSKNRANLSFTARRPDPRRTATGTTRATFPASPLSRICRFGRSLGPQDRRLPLPRQARAPGAEQRVVERAALEFAHLGQSRVGRRPFGEVSAVTLSAASPTHHGADAGSGSGASSNLAQTSSQHRPPELRRRSGNLPRSPAARRVDGAASG
jgi:hypothetical protein